MVQSKHLTVNIFVLVAIILFPLHVNCKPGIEAIRSQYGLSGVLAENEGTVGRVSQRPNGVVKGNVMPMEAIQRLQEGVGQFKAIDDDYDSEEVMGRSLLPARPIVVAIKPIARVSPHTIGKCFAEVITSSLVKPNRRVPPGNGSNPSLSIIETCCEGYERYVHNKSLCVASCKDTCINAICVRPNVCECFPDHVKSLNGDCTPTCPIGCLNGHCHWNGTCTCNPGYVTEPNHKFCVPYCSNGCGELFNCTGPESCTCLKGYQLNAMTGKCEPFCKIPCGNGNCVMPDVCSCFSGFRLVDGTCQANCSRGCVGGRCVANEVCACDPGWTLDATGSKCEPYCKKGCPNGKCVQPDKCSCDKGYKKLNNQCKPNCPRGCMHGTCTAPNTCTCRSGYTLSLLGIKCKKSRGFQINLQPLFDHVFNTPPKVHSILPSASVHTNVNRFPYQSQMNGGFAGQNHAQPIFNPSLIAQPSNLLPNQPLYNPPVIVSPIDKAIVSKPLRSPPIISNPSAPQNQPVNAHSSMYKRQPAYNPFYQPAPAASSATQKPNYLESQPGYNPFFPKPTSKPSNKHHITTVASRQTPKRSTHRSNVNAASSKSFSLMDLFRKPKNTTKNNRVWKMTTPNPTCDKTCLNGKCTGRNQCTCNSGYKLTSGSKHKCVAYCSLECKHGTCTAPEFCTCNFGYKKKSGKCVKG